MQDAQRRTGLASFVKGLRLLQSEVAKHGGVGAELAVQPFDAFQHRLRDVHAAKFAALAAPNDLRQAEGVDVHAGSSGRQNRG